VAHGGKAGRLFNDDDVGIYVADLNALWLDGRSDTSHFLDLYMLPAPQSTRRIPTRSSCDSYTFFAEKTLGLRPGKLAPGADYLDSRPTRFFSAYNEMCHGES
jgi:hypothetical protein